MTDKQLAEKADTVGRLQQEPCDAHWASLWSCPLQLQVAAQLGKHADNIQKPQHVMGWVSQCSMYLFADIDNEAQAQ